MINELHTCSQKLIDLHQEIRLGLEDMCIFLWDRDSMEFQDSYERLQTAASEMLTILNKMKGEINKK